jgi:hypothetical protein
MKLTLALAAAAATAAFALPASAGTYANPGDTSAFVDDWAVGSQFTNYAFSATTLTFIGSWEVDDGPNWTTVPTAYSGLTAAALLFGGSAADYFISTVDTDPANINHLSWVSTWGADPACGGAFPCGTEVDEAYVVSTGPGGNAVPEPASWALMIAGFGMVGASMRRRVALAA